MEALPILVENHRRFLSFLEKRVGSREDAEDILQSAFVKGIEHGKPIPSGEGAVAWFYRVLRNALTDYYRKRARTERGVAEISRHAGRSARTDEGLERVVCACVGDLIGILRPDYESILRRVDLDQVDVGEAARELELTPGNARVRLHRARQALRRELERSCGTCTEHGCLDCTCSRK